jgi:hypothetical protein
VFVWIFVGIRSAIVVIVVSKVSVDCIVYVICIVCVVGVVCDLGDGDEVAIRGRIRALEAKDIVARPRHIRVRELRVNMSIQGRDTALRSIRVCVRVGNGGTRGRGWGEIRGSRRFEALEQEA